MGNIQTAGPNEAIIASGGCCRPSRKQIIVGAEQFLGKTTEQIKSIALQTIEGHMRAVIGTQDLSDICKNRKELATLVRESATQDLVRMGIDVLSLTIKEIRDDVEYLSSTGKKTTARVRRDAAIAVAEAEREASKAEAHHDREKEEFKVEIEKALAQLKHDNECSIVGVRNGVAESRAEAEKAYDLELSRLQHDLRSKQIEVESITYAKHIEIQRLEAGRHQTQLEIDIELPTASEVYEMMKENEANEVRFNKEVEAEKFRIIEEGKAKALAIKLEGDAEAKGMKVVAEARKEFNEAACLSEYIKVIPDIAAELACPLSKLGEITLISDGHSSDAAQNGQFKVTNMAKMTSAVDSTLKSIGSDRATKSLVNSILQLQRPSHNNNNDRTK